MLFTVFAAASLLGNVPAAAESAEDTTGTCDCHSTCTGNSLMFNCGIASSDRWRNPCQDESFAALPFCDETLSIENRVIDLLKRIPDSEKLGSAGDYYF